MPEEKSEEEEEETFEQIPEEVPEIGEEVPSEDFLIKSEMLKAVREILNDKKLEDFVNGSPFEWIAAKSLRLTFFDERDVTILEREFEAYMCSFLNSLPSYVYRNVDVSQKLDAFKILFKSVIRRSSGTTKSRMNERYLLGAIIKHISLPAEEKKKGILERLSGGREE